MPILFSLPTWVMGISQGCNISGLWGGQRALLSPLHSCLGEVPSGFPIGTLMPKIGSTSGSQKVTCLYSLHWLGDLLHLVRDLLHRWLPLRLQGHQCRTFSASWLSLMISSSSMQVASNAHWWASLASWRASSHRLLLLWDLDWASGMACWPVGDGGCPTLVLFQHGGTPTSTNSSSVRTRCPG